MFFIIVAENGVLLLISGISLQNTYGTLRLSMAKYVLTHLIFS